MTAQESKEQVEQVQVGQASTPSRRLPRWFIGSVIVNIILVVGAVGVASGAAIIHQSDTNPNFCANCHIMQPNVESYLTSNHLDNVHAEAGVQCKECHSDYGIPEEVISGINYITGNYSVNQEGNILKRDFDDDLCTQCHGTIEEVAVSTDFLFYNPHGGLMGDFTCDTCHVSHGEQIDYCSECHTNGGQRMVEDMDAPRPELIGVPETHYGGMLSMSEAAERGAAAVEEAQAEEAAEAEATEESN